MDKIINKDWSVLSKKGIDKVEISCNKCSFTKTVNKYYFNNTETKCRCKNTIISYEDDNTLKRKLYDMKRRCLNKQDRDYPRYGGRGIEICDEWLDNPKKFILWASKNNYKKGLFIDREDSDGDYTPDNCRFVDTTTSNRNRSCNKLTWQIVLEIRNRNFGDLTYKEIGKIYDIPEYTISNVINKVVWNTKTEFSINTY